MLLFFLQYQIGKVIFSSVKKLHLVVVSISLNVFLRYSGEALLYFFQHLCWGMRLYFKTIVRLTSWRVCGLSWWNLSFGHPTRNYITRRKTREPFELWYITTGGNQMGRKISSVEVYCVIRNMACHFILFGPNPPNLIGGKEQIYQNWDIKVKTIDANDTNVFFKNVRFYKCFFHNSTPHYNLTVA